MHKALAAEAALLYVPICSYHQQYNTSSAETIMVLQLLVVALVLTKLDYGSAIGLLAGLPAVQLDRLRD